MVRSDSRHQIRKQGIQLYADGMNLRRTVRHRGICIANTYLTSSGFERRDRNRMEAAQLAKGKGWSQQS